jgi:hypothetical protein
MAGEVGEYEGSLYELGENSLAVYWEQGCLLGFIRSVGWLGGRHKVGQCHGDDCGGGEEE